MVLLLGLGPTELLVIVVVIVVLVMGPKKIPELFRAMGQSVGELKKGMKESQDELDADKSKKKKKGSKKAKKAEEEESE